jgi:hypothetical protein
MIKPRKSAWPIPGDTAADRARRIAQDLHRRLARHDPDEAAQVAARAAELGEPWLTPRPDALDLDALLSAPDMADYLAGDITADTIRQWASRGHIRRHKDDHGRTVYRVGDILDHVAQQRRHRAARRGA